jgi:hypothetical protein
MLAHPASIKSGSIETTRRDVRRRGALGEHLMGDPDLMGEFDGCRFTIGIDRKHRRGQSGRSSGTSLHRALAS